MPAKKVKSESKDVNEIKKDKKIEKKLVMQDKLYPKYRVALKEYKKSDIHELMKANAQETVSSLDEV